ncbi:hypothetical protein E2C01_009993 [Portunus trituberculatus]|uniref:Uncharacterized protein n=1 Tax=Portunus trituberculatus TaxID=210409 RepID=A0A5B7D7I5_PORTR|nr:hypothetical protein [Portunus trituberculatus]
MTWAEVQEITRGKDGEMSRHNKGATATPSHHVTPGCTLTSTRHGPFPVICFDVIYGDGEAVPVPLLASPSSPTLRE